MTSIINTRFRLLAVFLSALVWLSAMTGQRVLAAQLTVNISLSKQNMLVTEGGRSVGIWPVSTARKGYRTPLGTFRPVRLERMWYSTKYDNAPMPHSVFFLGGYAIHGTTDLKNLGRAASHGCIRLHPDNARTLYNLIRKNGKSATRIIIRR